MPTNAAQGSVLHTDQIAVLKAPPPSVWPCPAGRQRITGKAAGQPLYFTQPQPAHVGQSVVSVPVQPLSARM